MIVTLLSLKYFKVSDSTFFSTACANNSSGSTTIKIKNKRKILFVFIGFSFDDSFMNRYDGEYSCKECYDQ